MTQELAEIIKNAERKECGVFNEFLIVPTGEKYDGFWGANGFDKILLLAKGMHDEDFCILTDYSDSFHLINSHSVNFDIPSDLGVVRVFTDESIVINYPESSVLGFVKKGGVKNV